MIVRFKSIQENYDKEKSGAKSNTVRIIQLPDLRIDYLRAGASMVEITLPDGSGAFQRHITDYTEWNGLAIISWDSREI